VSRFNDQIAETTPGTYLYGRIMDFRQKAEAMQRIVAAEAAASKAHSAEMWRQRREVAVANRNAQIEGAKRAVVCIETGKGFDSVKAAAASVGKWRTGMSQALRTGGTCGGFHWRYADDKKGRAA
jgi:hypothetical protein